MTKLTDDELAEIERLRQERDRLREENKTMRESLDEISCEGFSDAATTARLTLREIGD